MKALTREQLEDRKAKAVRFLENVLGDPDRAAEVEDESLEDYAARRRIQLVNLNRSSRTMATKRELEERISELEDENQELSDQLDSIADIVAPDEEPEEEEEEYNDEQGEE